MIKGVLIVLGVITVLMLWCCVRINSVVELVDDDLSSYSTEVTYEKDN